MTQLSEHLPPDDPRRWLQQDYMQLQAELIGMGAALQLIIERVRQSDDSELLHEIRQIAERALVPQGQFIILIEVITASLAWDRAQQLYQKHMSDAEQSEIPLPLIQSLGSDRDQALSQLKRAVRVALLNIPSLATYPDRS